MSKDQVELSIVVPYYGCDKSLITLCERLNDELVRIKLKSEVIFVLDGPEGGSWEYLKKTTEKFGFKSVKLIRNFGQHAATKAGLSLAQGKLIVTLDCDMQDPPEMISKMILEMSSDVDVIFTKRQGSYDGKYRRYSRSLSKFALKKIYPGKFDLDISSFMLLRSKVVKQLLKIKGPDHIGLLVNWLDYPSKSIQYNRETRDSGSSSYSFKKLMSHGIEALSFDLSHFFRISISASLVFSFLALAFGLSSLVEALISKTPSGWASIFVISSIGFSLTLTLLSLIGYSVVQNQHSEKTPLYIIDERDE